MKVARHESRRCGHFLNNAPEDKTMKTFKALCAAVFAAALAACGGGGGGDDSAPVPPIPPVTVQADVTVAVADTAGRFVDGATVTVASTGVSASTDASGRSVLKVPVGSEVVLNIAKPGFAQQVKVVNLAPGATTGSLRTMLIAREAAQTIAAIESGGSATGKHGVKVEFPAGALVNAAGQPVTGAIEMLMTPVNVTDVDVSAFPGLFEGNAAGTTRGTLLSFGTAEFVPQQAGQKLNLVSGKTATIELPLYATAQPDGSAIRAGDTIPLWSLDATTGVWMQDGSGTIVTSAGSPTGLAMRASVSHFSWWNIDQLSQRATVTLTVTAPGETVPANTAVAVEGRVQSGSGPAWAATTSTVVGAATPLRLPAPSSVQLTVRFELANKVCQGSTTVDTAPGTDLAAAISVVCIEVPVPTIVRPAGFTLTNATSPMSLLVEVNGRVPDKVELLVDGVSVAETGAQFFYRFAWDNRTATEGLHNLTARATLGSNSRTSAPLQVRIDRTPPQVTRVEPASTVEVSRATVFTIDFDDQVSPLPFALPDAVRLSVTPLGQAVPVPVDAEISLDTDGRRLTVRPRTDLPIGVVGLNWGGMRDLATNAVTGNVGRTWSVDRSVQVGPTLSHEDQPNGMAAVLAVASDGRLFAAHRAVGDRILLSRHDGAADRWQELAPPANERTTLQTLALAIDNADVPHIAFAQQRAADPTRYEMVLKRLNGAAWELAAPVVPIDGQRVGDIGAGALAFDGSNRAVLVFTDATLGAMQALRLEQGVLVSMAPALQGFTPTLALRADGTPFVAFRNINGWLLGAAIVGGAWQGLGVIDSIPNSTQQITSARIVLRGAEPWVVWSKFLQDSGYRLTAARYDGTQWVAQPFDTPVIQEGEVCVAGDDVIVAHRAGGNGNGLAIRRFRDGAWEPAFDATTVTPVDFRLAARGGTAAIITNSRNQATVQRLAFP
jgi:hypothetical protein